MQPFTHKFRFFKLIFECNINSFNLIQLFISHFLLHECIQFIFIIDFLIFKMLQLMLVFWIILIGFLSFNMLRIVVIVYGIVIVRNKLMHMDWSCTVTLSWILLQLILQLKYKSSIYKNSNIFKCLFMKMEHFFQLFLWTKWYFVLSQLLWWFLLPIPLILWFHECLQILLNYSIFSSYFLWIPCEIILLF